MYRPKLMGKPLVLDVTTLLKRIQDAIQAIFKTYPTGTGGVANTAGHRIGSAVADVERSKRGAKSRAELWKGKSVVAMSRNLIR
jgi:hypothetical protein